MWWDLFWVVPVPAEREVIFGAIVRSLTTILNLSSMACQEAALHGFGHLLESNESAIQAVIDAGCSNILRCAQNCAPMRSAPGVGVCCDCLENLADQGTAPAYFATWVESMVGVVWSIEH
jgi:hypothetical protein